MTYRGILNFYGFNPLRFGAGALPATRPILHRLQPDVSIPFVSGRGHARSRVLVRKVTGDYVSIPFVSGREHSRYLEFADKSSAPPPFQSPSFRGGSTPLGAKVRIDRSAITFQSPSFRGGSTPIPALIRDRRWRTRFNPHRFGWTRTAIRFNPLRFGAGALPVQVRLG